MKLLKKVKEHKIFWKKKSYYSENKKGKRYNAWNVQKDKCTWNDENHEKYWVQEKIMKMFKFIR